MSVGVLQGAVVLVDVVLHHAGPATNFATDDPRAVDILTLDEEG